MTTTLAERLAATAKGTYPTEAAAHILTHALGGRLLHKLSPAVNDEPEHGRAWISWDVALEISGPFSGGEQRLINIAASLWVGHPIDANDTFCALDNAEARIVVAAIAHCLHVKPL